MAAALQPLHSNSNSSSLYPRSFMNDFEYGDNRYPALKSQSRVFQQSTSRPGSKDRSWQQQSMNNSDGQSARPTVDSPRVAALWQSTADSPIVRPENQYPLRSSPRQDQRSPEHLPNSYEQNQENQRAALSYSLPSSTARRVAERYNFDDSGQRAPSRGSNELNQQFIESHSVQETITGRSRPRTPTTSRVMSPQGRVSPNHSISRRSPLPNGQSTPPHVQDGVPAVVPFSVSTNYAPPVAPNHRAYPQQPTYVNQSNANNSIQPVYTPVLPQQEEVCVECAMRDQDMADVDATSPGVWDRASDADFEQLKKRELEDAAAGILNNDPTRPRTRGGRLSEQNVKIWLSINPREPASKQQTLNTYIRSQRALLEAEAVAHARALQEAKQIDNRMRDAYSQLRRSAYDSGTAISPIDDLGGVRIKPPSSPATPAHHNRARSHSREITLLENGMIIEHVDVKKEEREARERRKKDEKRARKSSKSSAMDVRSIISVQSTGQFIDGGLKPSSSRYSQAHSARPASVFSPTDRPDIPRAYSQLSFSDAQSLGSASPRRTRFFGMKNLSTGWRSQDSLAPSGMSGSMIDMHVALQRDGYRSSGFATHPIDLNTPRRSQVWPPLEIEELGISRAPVQDDKTKKKMNGLTKIWRKVIGKNEGQRKDVSHCQGPQDDLPLAPPPPLSYLVERKLPNEFGSNSGFPHSSTPSLPSSTSPKFMQGQLTPGMSPPTAPSSILPSPASLHQSGDIEIAIADGRHTIEAQVQVEAVRQEDIANKMQSLNLQSMQSLPSESDLRQQPLRSTTAPSFAANGNNTLRPMALVKEKSLPPLPVGEAPAQVLPSDRPKTFYGLDSTPKAGSHDLAPPEAPFRAADGRRQSFGGVTARPNLGLQTMPIIKPVDFDSQKLLGARYDEFGFSRRSLGRLDSFQSQPVSPMSTKRKSKFGLTSLLGKKSDKREQDSPQYDNEQPPYDNQDEMTTGYATSTSRHSALSSGNPNVRMSVFNRRPLEELVQQDSEFLAYRYPSNEQRLDLLR